MKTVVVRSPDGTWWGIRVNWRPRRQFLLGRFTAWRAARRVARRAARRGGGGSSFDVGDLGGDLGGIVIGVLVIVGLIILAVIVVWWVLLPVLLAAVDAALVLTAIIGRVVFRRPWAVQATSSEHMATAQVVGWHAALRRRDEIVEQLTAGLWPFETAPPQPPSGNI